LHANDDSPVVFTNPDKPCFSGEVTHIWDQDLIYIHTFLSILGLYICI